MYEIKIKKYLPITLKVDNFFKINTKIKLKLFLQTQHSLNGTRSQIQYKTLMSKASRYGLSYLNGLR